MSRHGEIVSWMALMSVMTDGAWYKSAVNTFFYVSLAVSSASSQISERFIVSSRLGVLWCQTRATKMFLQDTKTL
jgi:hypothetical protein